MYPLCRYFLALVEVGVNSEFNFVNLEAYLSFLNKFFLFIDFLSKGQTDGRDGMEHKDFQREILYQIGML